LGLVAHFHFTKKHSDAIGNTVTDSLFSWPTILLIFSAKSLHEEHGRIPPFIKDNDRRRGSEVNTFGVTIIFWKSSEKNFGTWLNMHYLKFFMPCTYQNFGL
jgi:hypothetical protein